MPIREVREPEQVRVEQRRLPLPLAAHEPPGQQRERDRADRDQQPDGLASFLPHQDPEHDAAHADDGEDRADHVDLPRPGVGDVVDELDLGQHDRDDDDLEHEADPPRQVRGDEAAEQRPDRGGDRRRRPDQRVRLLAGRASKFPWISDCIAGSSSDAPEPADDRPEDDDRGQALRQRHRQGADRVGQQTEDVRPLAPDQIADLAADQDERSRDQRLERDRRLHTAHRRVEILDDRRDRHVHQRRVDDEHEHRRRQEDRESRAAPFLGRNARARALGQGRSALPTERRSAPRSIPRNPS